MLPDKAIQLRQVPAHVIGGRSCLDDFGQTAQLSDVIDLANKLSAQKWEMISVVGAGTGGYVAFFNRAKQ